LSIAIQFKRLQVVDWINSTA